MKNIKLKLYLYIFQKQILFTPIDFEDFPKLIEQSLRSYTVF